MKESVSTNSDTEKKGQELYQLEPAGNLKDFLLPLVEFFGILIPGIVFLIALVPSIIIPLFLLSKVITVYLSEELYSYNKHIAGSVLFYSDLINKILIVAKDEFIKTHGFLFFIFSYVLGNIFFRQDIKIPDFYSFIKTSERYKEVGPVRRNINDDDESYKQAAKFPYRDLDLYLECRGMKYLAEKLPWKRGALHCEHERNYRTRHFINNIKIHLEFLFHRQYIKIQKNEAHVRLMSSIWYVLTTIIYVSSTVFLSGLAILFIAICSYGIFEIKSWSAGLLEIKFGSTGLLLLLYFLSPPLFVFFISRHVRHGIEKFLHHQRVREIIFILEMAHFADNLRKDLNIWGNNPLGLDNSSKNCDTDFDQRTLSQPTKKINGNEKK